MAAPVTRHFQKGDAASTAIYSDCGRYRYLLARQWGEGAPLLYIMLNPSKATEEHNDPTIERCERRARRLGYPGFEVVNLFAWRETSPANLRRSARPVGARNDAQILAAAGRAGLVLCAWGVHGAHQGRAEDVRALLDRAGYRLWHLGLSKQGHPRHPLYLPYDRQPLPWVGIG